MANQAAPPGPLTLARVWFLTVLTWLLYLVPPVLSTLALAALLVSVWPRVNLLVIFLALVIFGLWMQILGAVNVARRGLSAADVRRFQLAHASGTGGAYDTTDAVDAYARFADQGPASDALRELPALHALVVETAARFGLAAPVVHLGRGGFGVIVHAKAERVTIGTALLAVASPEELQAELARQLAPHGRARAALLALGAARAASAAGAWRPPGITSRLDFVWWPASEAARLVAKTAAQLASEVRVYAAVEAALAAGPSAEVAAARGLVLPELWREHVRVLQRSWTSEGTAMAPHEGWAANWAARQGEHRPIAVDPDDLFDAVSLVGWPVAAPDSATIPPLAIPSALDRLAGAIATDALARFDQLASSQYFEPMINASLGAATQRIHEDPEDQGWAGQVAAQVAPASAAAFQNPMAQSIATDAPFATGPVADPPTEPQLDARFLPLVPDERAALPQVDLVVRQLDALDEAMHRRDGEALATARAIAGVAQVPTVQTMAAGVRWLCGDPAGISAIHAALREAPRGAAALFDLVPALRAAGETETAKAVQAAVTEVEHLAVARFNLRQMWGRGPKLLPAEVPPAVLEAFGEIAGLYKGRVRVYAADVDVQGSAMRPTVLVVVKSFWTLSLGGHEGDPASLARIVWPAARVLSTEEVEGRRRKHLRKHFKALGRSG